MEKDHKRLRLSFGATPIIFLLTISILFVAVDFFWGKSVQFDRWVQYLSVSETTHGEEHKFMNLHISRLVRAGEDGRNLEADGFACDKTYHSFLCVTNKPARIDASNMTVYLPSHDNLGRVTVVRPYARQEDDLTVITPVSITQYRNITNPPSCEYEHGVPAVIFSSGSTGNVFHEMNEIIIPLYITTRHFQSRVRFILEDYKESFMNKYGKVLSHLTDYEIMNPSVNKSVHCFPGLVVGLKYHDNLAVNSSDIPGGYSMSDFRQFLRQAFSLKYIHVSQINKPRLMLLSRTNTRRILNEDEMISMMEDIGFQVIVVKRSKLASNLNKFSQLINSCSVLVGAHGAGLTNEIFLPSGAVMIQVELLGTEWASNTYYGDTARAMNVHYLRYKIEPEESTLLKLYGANHPVITDQGSVYAKGGYRAARTVFLDQQNVRLNLGRFRMTLVEALSIVTELD